MEAPLPVSFTSVVCWADFDRLNTNFLGLLLPPGTDLFQGKWGASGGVFRSMFPECIFEPASALGKQKVLILFPKYFALFLNELIGYDNITLSYGSSERLRVMSKVVEWELREMSSWLYLGSAG
jgi:hypothetical protein